MFGKILKFCIKNCIILPLGSWGPSMMSCGLRFLFWVVFIWSVEVREKWKTKFSEYQIVIRASSKKEAAPALFRRLVLSFSRSVEDCQKNVEKELQHLAGQEFTSTSWHQRSGPARGPVGVCGSDRVDVNFRNIPLCAKFFSRNHFFFGNLDRGSSLFYCETRHRKVDVF